MDLFTVPSWEKVETKRSVSYDFEKKKVKRKKPKTTKGKQENGETADDNTMPETSLVKVPYAPAPEKNVVKKPKMQKVKKQDLKRKLVEDKQSVPPPVKAKKQKPQENGSTKTNTFKDQLVESLKGSRFRFLNEVLYTTKSQDAVDLFKSEPNAFAVYHDGYRQQVQQWPLNPLDRVIKAVRKLPKEYVIADFGCGEARLAESVPNKVYSLDLVAHNEKVTACDMAHTHLQHKSVNVVVFCLSLMGLNLVDFLREANRVLKRNGILKIAEVKSRFDSVDTFVYNIQKCGFKLVDKDLTNSHFYFFNFKKMEDIEKGKKWSTESFQLKPCMYKKR